MKFSRVVVLPLFVALLASMAVAQSTNQKLISNGTTALSSPSGGVVGADDLLTKPMKETDHQVGPVIPNAALTVPGPAPQGAPAAAANAIGFNGISHFDQRTAGTGIYTNSQFSTEPPDQGLAAGEGFILEAVNDALAVYSQRSHALLVGPTALEPVLQAQPGGHSLHAAGVGRLSQRSQGLFRSANTPLVCDHSRD